MKNSINYLMIVALFFVTACQQSSTTDATEALNTLYSNNEIPISTESEEALKQIVDGLHYLDQGYRENAAPYFDKAIELDPECVSAHMYRAFSSTSWSEWGDRREKILAMRDKANEGESMMLDIVENGKEGNSAKELELAIQLVEKYPKSARAAETLADAYAGTDDTENARKHWKKSMELDSDFIKAIKNLGESYLFESPKDFKMAEKYMAMTVDIAPNSSRAHIDLGDTYRAQNDLEKALASYTKAAELDPNDQVAHSKAGHANSFLGNFEAARQNFKESRKVSPYGLASFDFEAFTYLYEGDHKKAMASMLDAVKTIDGMDIPEGNKNGAKLGLIGDCARMAMHQGDVKQLKEMVEMFKPLSLKMAEDLNAATAERNQKANRQYWDAVLAVMDGDYEGAAATADKINTTLEASTSPNKMRRYHRVHALVNYQQKNYEKAIEHMNELDPDNVYDSYWKAKAYQMSGNTEKAMEIFGEIADWNFNAVGYALIRKEVKEILATAV